MTIGLTFNEWNAQLIEAKREERRDRRRALKLLREFQIEPPKEDGAPSNPATDGHSK